MLPSSELNRRNLFDGEDFELDDPTTPCGSSKRDYHDVMDYSFGSGNLLSQNDVGWGSPMDDSSKEAAEIRKKRRLANKTDNITTPLRVIKRCASSPALSGNRRRSDPKQKPDEVKNLNDIFEDDENYDTGASQELNFDWSVGDDGDNENDKTIVADTSFDDYLATLPVDEIAKAAKKGAQKVEVKVDPLVGSSQIVRTELPSAKRPPAPAPVKTFVRHASLPISPAHKSPEEVTKRKCTPAEIAAKRQAALEKLKKSRNNVIQQSQRPTQSSASQIATNKRTGELDDRI